ncbi:hypothetical protein [Paenibacillus sp. Soil750]|uniref:hypothetical protein n=1 Tax=Paenibacillus sp. Soil750 TaxID=1736398 RepID=UPI0006F52FAC|nr:hypothetical protein [Paenibacillus sp. Soil750]KRE71989.1 hypothetical protein ASL11_09440 [Paenibacillus sp. Soil750]
MHPIQSQYQSIIQEEATLMQRISLCKVSIDILLEYISRHADSIHILTAEDIVTSIHTMTQDLDTELLHVRLEKGILENKLHGLQLQADLSTATVQSS